MFFVRSLEPFSCPGCRGEKATVIGSRNRKTIEISQGNLQTKTIRIRRLKCSTCGRIHHELPGSVIPYKRHAVTNVELVLEGDAAQTAVEDSTIRRWKTWFEDLACHLLGVLHTLTGDNTVEKTPYPGTPLQRLRKYVGNAAGWLSRVVQQIVKKNLWVQTRSAFSAG